MPACFTTASQRACSIDRGVSARPEMPFPTESSRNGAAMVQFRKRESKLPAAQSTADF
jgi:hypothetical protein